MPVTRSSSDCAGSRVDPIITLLTLVSREGKERKVRERARGDGTTWYTYKNERAQPKNNSGKERVTKSSVTFKWGRNGSRT